MNRVSNTIILNTINKTTKEESRTLLRDLAMKPTPAGLSLQLSGIRAWHWDSDKTLNTKMLLTGHECHCETPRALSAVV